MARLKGSTVKEFDLQKLEKEGELDLLMYINTATILNWIPKNIKRTVTALLSIGKCEIKGTKIVLLSNGQDDANTSTDGKVGTGQSQSEGSVSQGS